MNTLIVCARPEPASFNAALKAEAVRTLAEAGHKVVVSELHAGGFGAVAGPDDLHGERGNPERLNLPREQGRAVEAGTLAPEIRQEQEKLAAAELLILQFPIWWFGMPAILEGWADRVLAYGFAYQRGREHDSGMFRGKLAMVSATTGTSADTYAPDGIDGDILSVLRAIHDGMLRYAGFDVLPPCVSYMPGRLDAAGRETRLAALRARLLSIDETPRLYFHPAEDHGPDERLKPGVPARSGVRRNP